MNEYEDGPESQLEKEWDEYQKQGYFTRVYAPDGNTRKGVFIQPFDLVEWKRNGTAGAFKGLVISVGKVIRVEFISHDGRNIAPFKVNIRGGLLHAWRDGIDLGDTP